MSLGLRWICRLPVNVFIWVVVGFVVVYAQTEDTGDTLCLQQLKSNLSESSNELLSNWTGADFPCNNGTNGFVGITCASARVVGIKLSSLRLKGFITTAISSCTNLQSLDLSDNDISGEIPTQLGDLSYLITLNLSKNELSGPIPDVLSKSSDLNVIDLQKNRLTGQIPSVLGGLQRLTVFDVSDNDLSGPIPTSLSNTSSGGPRFNRTSFEGNKNLYGYPLPNPKSHSLSVLAIVGIGLGSGMLSLVVSFTAVCIWLRVTEQRLAAEEGKISQLMPES